MHAPVCGVVEAHRAVPLSAGAVYCIKGGYDAVMEKRFGRVVLRPYEAEDGVNGASKY